MLAKLKILLARGALESSQLLSAVAGQRKADVNARPEQRLARHSSRNPAPELRLKAEQRLQNGRGPSWRKPDWKWQHRQDGKWKTRAGGSFGVVARSR